MKSETKVLSTLCSCPFCGSAPRVDQWVEYDRSWPEPQEYERLRISCCYAEAFSVEDWNSRHTYVLNRHLIDLDYPGDAPRADADEARWIAAASAFESAVPEHQQGFAEWQARMQAAIRVLAGGSK